MLATRRTQTNETARCAGLLPTFAAVGDERPLAVIEVGAGAGAEPERVDVRRGDALDELRD